MLFKLVFKSVVQRPLRYALTSFAIIFSVAAVAGVFIFTGGLRVTFGELAENIESGYDIAIQPVELFGATDTNLVAVDQLDLIAGVDGVLAAQPRIVDVPVIPVDGEGELVFAPAGPNLGVAWSPPGPRTSLYLQDGEQPDAPDEFAIDIDTFAAGDFELGERYAVNFTTEVDGDPTFVLTGTFTFANPDRNALVGAAIVAFDEDTALRVLADDRGFSDVVVVLEEGADIDAVISDISALVDDDLQVRSQEEVLEETQGDFGQILTIFQTVLLVFAIIILLVSAFLIFNVFSITLGQRIRELGLLRAVGALGSQITKLMLGEALMLGVFSTILGIPAGLGLAYLLREALVQLGFPDNTGLPLAVPTLIIAAVTGIGVTLLAALWPSIQARRVSPLAAMRDGANQTELQANRNVPLGLGVVLLGVAAFAGALVLSGWAPKLFLPLLGSLLVFGGVALIARRTASFVMLPTGIGILFTALLGSFELGETFGLIGAGAGVSLIGAYQISPLIAKPVTSLFGRAPSMILFGLLGAAFVLTSIGLIVGAAAIAINGVPDSVIDATGSDLSPLALVIPLIIGALFFAIAGYGVTRTAFGARGLAGQLARANAGRNPQRTATTAAALMIGLTLVTAVTVIGDSIKSSVSDALDSSITSDWLVQGVQGQAGGSPFPAAAGDRLLELDEVESIERFRVAFPAAWVTSESGELNAEDFIEFLPIVTQLLDDGADLDPQELLALQSELGTDVEFNDASATDFTVLEEHINPDFVEIDRDLAAQDNALYIVDQFAEEKGLEIGDTFTALFPDLQSEDLVVAGIYENGFVLGNRVVKIELWQRHFPDASDNFLTINTASGIPDDEARAVIEEALAEDFPVLTVFTREEFSAQAETQINQTLATVNVLLGLSAVIAALGILVALALSVFERTREIGLFRAVGSTRAQTRWIIRWEGVIIAFFGGILGIVLGVGLGVLVTAKLPEVLVNTISVPIPTLVTYLVVAALTGLGAAVFPAWIAGRMNVLDAVSSE